MLMQPLKNFSLLLIQFAFKRHVVVPKLFNKSSLNDINPHHSVKNKAPTADVLEELFCLSKTPSDLILKFLICFLMKLFGWS